ncbi:MAG: hypothetical protein NC320_06275 [Clostridium sp.]|nr:hypothetical protein [Clostridium sp.]MCM1547616.1 hypothetical protein [Ruminococcus sp.]
MSKSMNKIVLKCILGVCIISIPFIFANYFITNYFIEHGKYFHDYDVTILNILQAISVIAVGIIMKTKNKNIIIENKDIAKKYMLGSLIAFFAIALLYITDIYWHIYITITGSLQILDKAPLFLAVCWEQILNGKLFLAISLCILICFITKIKFRKNNVVVS